MRVTFALFALLAACDPGRSVVTPGPAPAPAPAPAPTPVVAAPAPTPPGPALSLGERLAAEAKARPSGTVRIEDLALALRGHGVAIARTRQVLGSTLGARYCSVALTEKGLGLAACEFESPESAEMGRAQSIARFDKAIPGRRLVVNGKTLLTVAPAASALAEESQAATTLFATLSPPQ